MTGPDYGLWLESVFSVNMPGTMCGGAAPLSIPAWPSPPAIRLNSLWWPRTGATRWARGLFLVTDAVLEAIATAQAGQAVAVSFEHGSTKTTVQMIPLAARRLTSPEPSTAGVGRLWLLPMVDQRYFWQFRPVEVGEVTRATGWYDILARIENAIGPIHRDPVEAAFLGPDPATWNHRMGPAGVMLDAVAASICRRPAIGTDGTVSLKTPDSSQYQVIEELGERRIAGGESKDRPRWPERVRVAGPWAKDGVIQPDQAPYTAEYFTGIPNAPADSVWLVQTTLQAKYQESQPDTPSNAAAFDNLAAAIGENMAQWAKSHYRATFSGITDWAPTDQDDFIWLQDGTLWPIDIEIDLLPGAHASMTQGASLPDNVLPQWCYCQDQSEDPGECPSTGYNNPLCRFALTADLATTDGQGTGDIKQVYAGDEDMILDDQGDLPLGVVLLNVPAKTDNIFEGETGAMGLCMLTNSSKWLDPATPEYVIIQMECPPAASQ